jgi:gamma-glutamylcyclotransferase (GGCT)/AIG2-like uncharacterized protein YtfP
MEPLTAIFVYGTLMKGQVRETCWPRSPLHIMPAVARGTLYDLGPHPAMIEGNDRVAGELWHIREQDVAETLTVLDEVEGFNDSPDDWYRRVVIECETAAERTSAWTYLYARPAELRTSQRLQPDVTGVCHWSRCLTPDP